jgi:hypothetical protein
MKSPLLTKQNPLRKPEYRLHTVIYKQNGRIYVKKYLDDARARRHLLNLPINIVRLEQNSKSIHFSKIISVTKTNIVSEYINLPSLERLIERAITDRNFSSTYDYVNLINKVLDSISCVRANPYDNESFSEYFDPIEKYFSEEKIPCLKIAVIDLNYDNILLGKNDQLYMLDREWVFDFPISRRYVAFRSLFYLSQKLQSLIATFCCSDFPSYEVVDKLLIPIKWFDIFGFSQTEVKQYLYYENQFQNIIQLANQKFNSNVVLKKKKLVNKRFSFNLERHLLAIQEENKSLRNKVENLKTLLYSKSPLLFFFLRQFNKLKQLIIKRLHLLVAFSLYVQDLF